MRKKMKNTQFIILLAVIITGFWWHSGHTDGYMLREEAAVIALRVLNGVDYEPPLATGEVFADMTDVDYWGTKWAEAAYHAGLFAGCGEEDGMPLFCPGGGK